jgi:S-adenosylmethionine synthetase
MDPSVSSRYTFTSESVTEGHPDKMADQISDAMLDAMFDRRPASRVACETLLTTGLVLVAGEITTSRTSTSPGWSATWSRDHRLRRRRLRLRRQHLRGDIVSIDQQSPTSPSASTTPTRSAGHRWRGPLNAQGAGDQGMMFGYACDETPDLMPLPIWLAHRLAQRLAQVRRVGVLPYLRPDGKTQVSVSTRTAGRSGSKTVLISTQHGPASTWRRS